MHAVISLLFQSKKILVISLTDFFDPASRRHNDVIVLPAIRRVSGNDFVFHVTARCAAHVQQLYCCVKKRQTFLRQICGLQTAQISVLWITRSGLSCSIVSTTDKSIVWMSWNGSSSMSGAVLSSRFLTRLLTSGEEHFQRVSMLKDIWSTACELTMLILSISVTFSVTCLTVTYLNTQLCMPATLANTFLFILQWYILGS